MIGLVLLLVASSDVSVTAINGLFTPAFPPLCAYYGSGQCCPQVTPTQASIDEGQYRPLFVKFAPRAQAEGVDNICYTMSPLPDNSNTFQMFTSTVYCDGTNTVDTFVLTQNFLGTFTAGSPQCTFVDVEFAKIALQCDTNVFYRCILNGDCSIIPGGTVEPIFGMSFQRQRLPKQCWNLINNVILNNGFPYQDYLSLPMRLPSRCVNVQTCFAPPISQLFRSAAGIY